MRLETAVSPSSFPPSFVDDGLRVRSRMGSQWTQPLVISRVSFETFWCVPSRALGPWCGDHEPEQATSLARRAIRLSWTTADCGHDGDEGFGVHRCDPGVGRGFAENS
jgi:hypothetical protein